MSFSLENTCWRFTMDPRQACWSLEGREKNSIRVEHVSTKAIFRRDRRKWTGLENWEDCKIGEPTSQPSALGRLEQLSISTGPAPQHGLRFTLTFALPEHSPLFLWKLDVENCAQTAVYLDRLELFNAGGPRQTGTVYESRLSLAQPGSELAFFSNGWQSWNYTGAYGVHDRFRRTRFGPLTAPMRVNAGTPQPHASGHFASDMFGVLGDRRSRQAMLVGFLAQQVHFGSLEARFNSTQAALHLWANGDGARLDPGKHLETDWACLLSLDLNQVDPLLPYLEAVARFHGLPPNGSPSSPNPALNIAGWSSWYHFYQNVTAQDVRANLQAARELREALPLQLIQIDDGFETQVGDWFSFRDTFPDGVAPLAAEIRAAGFMPGLWLAPFILVPNSKLAAQHPDWLLRGKFQRPVNAGFSMWGNFTTALDLTHPQALAYAQEVLHTAVHRWGFPYIKLDFLYAAALPGHHRDPSRTRAQVLRAGLEALRQAAGENTLLLGCGCPLGSAIGLVDMMRIGADVSPGWLPEFSGIRFFFSAEPDYPSTRNAIHNSLTRASMHSVWWDNDPDALLLRKDTQLTLAEVQSLATVIALTGGTLILSDHLPGLSSERLQIARKLLPLTGKRPWIPDWMDAATPRRLRLDLSNATGNWHILAAFNWQDLPCDVPVRLADYGLESSQSYYASEFWNGKIFMNDAHEWYFEAVPAHGVVLLALRPKQDEAPQYLGSDLHISQGLEVSAWQLHAGETRSSSYELGCTLERPGAVQGEVKLKLPSPPQYATLNGTPQAWEERADGCFSFPLAFEQTASLEVRG